MTLSSPRMCLALSAFDVTCATKPSAAVAYQDEFNVTSGGKVDIPPPHVHVRPIGRTCRQANEIKNIAHTLTLYRSARSMN